MYYGIGMAYQMVIRRGITDHAAVLDVFEYLSTREDEDRTASRILIDTLMASDIFKFAHLEMQARDASVEAEGGGA